MKYVLILLFLASFFRLFGQGDSIKVFFYGNLDNGEQFKVFWDGKLIQKVKASDSYKYSFLVPRENWTEGDLINEISLYRRGRLGFKWREVGVTLLYEKRKYIRMYRSHALKNWSAVFVEWTDEEPRKPPSSRI